MSDTATRDQLDGAAAYERLLVPALVAPWAPMVAAAAGIHAGQDALDVACGTGVLGREVLRRAGASGCVAGVDAHPGMLAVARRLAPSIDWRHASAEALPFDDETFDAVVSQFGLMFFGDPRQAIDEMARVLKPGGRLAVAVWDAIERNEPYAVELAIVERIAGPRAAEPLRSPFALGDRRALEPLFSSGPLSPIAVSTGTAPARFPSLRAMIEADVCGWLPVHGVELPQSQVDAIFDAAATELSSFVEPDGAVAFPTSAHIVTGIKRN